MKRHVIQFVFALLFGVTAATGFLAAGAVNRVANAEGDQIETSDSSDNNTFAKVQQEGVAQDYKTTRAKQTGGTTISVTVKASSYITIGGRSIQIFDTGTTAVDAGNRVARYGSQFLFGHNSSAVFGHLAGLPVGTVFSVTINNETTTYRISNVVVFEHEKEGGVEYLYPTGTSAKRNYMNSIARAKDPSGRQYDLSIMTCHGQMLGGGDATQRLVVYADRI